MSKDTSDMSMAYLLFYNESKANIDNLLDHFNSLTSKLKFTLGVRNRAVEQLPGHNDFLENRNSCQLTSIENQHTVT